MLCKNCDTKIQEETKYCPECGQKVDDKLTIAVLFNSTISNYFSIDSRFYKSLLPLLFRPSYLASEYIEGRRQKYLHPGKFYLSISVIFFFLLSFALVEKNKESEDLLKKGFEFNLPDTLRINTGDEETIEMDTLIEKEEQETPFDIIEAEISDGFFSIKTKQLDSLIALNASEEEILAAVGYKKGQHGKIKEKIYTQGLKLYKKQGSGLFSTVFNSIPITMFLLMPLFALLLKLFFYRKGTYAEHLVFSLYLFTFLFSIGMFFVIFNLAGVVPMSGLANIVTIYIFIYFILSIYLFYDQKILKTLMKSFSILFLFSTILVPVSLVIIGVMSFLMY